jgi:hypothetical protein
MSDYILDGVRLFMKYEILFLMLTSMSILAVSTVAGLFLYGYFLYPPTRSITPPFVRQYTPPSDILPPELFPRVGLFLLLENITITISRGESSSIPILVLTRQEGNVSLTINRGDIPTAITAFLDQTSLAMKANSAVTVNLTISIGNDVMPGTYNLGVTGTQTTSNWTSSFGAGLAVSVPPIVMMPWWALLEN